MNCCDLQKYFEYLYLSAANYFNQLVENYNSVDNSVDNSVNNSVDNSVDNSVNNNSTDEDFEILDNVRSN